MFCCRRRQSDLVVVGRGGFRAVEVYGRDFVKEGPVETPAIQELYCARNSWSRKLAPL